MDVEPVLRNRIPKSFRREKPSVSLRPPNAQIMTKSDLAEDTTHFSDQNLFTAPLDGVVSEQSNTVFAVGEEVIAPPGVRVGRGGDDQLLCGRRH